MAATIEHAFEIDIYHRVEILFFHPRKQSVACNARVVHKNIDGAEFFLGLFHHFPDFVKFTHVRFDGNGAHTQGFDFFYDARIIFLVKQIIHNHIIAVFCKAQRDRPSDPARRARHNCCFCHFFTLRIPLISAPLPSA